MATTAEALKAVHDLMATDSRDWARTRNDAWLWGVLVGWDCEEEHDHEQEYCGGGALAEIAEKHRLTAAQVDRVKTLRRAIREAS